MIYYDVVIWVGEIIQIAHCDNYLIIKREFIFS
jgi:hypothetical protein